MAEVTMRGELLTVKRVAEEMGTSLPWVYKLLEHGDLPYIDTDWGRLVLRGALVEYMQHRAYKMSIRAAAVAAR